MKQEPRVDNASGTVTKFQDVLDEFGGISSLLPRNGPHTNLSIGDDFDDLLVEGEEILGGIRPDDIIVEST